MTEHTVIPIPKYIFIAISPYLFLALTNGFYNPLLYPSHQMGFWFLDVMQMLVFPFAALFILSHYFGIIPGNYGLVKPGKNYPAWEMAGAGIFVAIVLLMVSTVFWYVGVILFGNEDFKFAFSLVIPEGVWHFPIVFYLAISAGVVEEIIFRGLTWTIFSEMDLGRFKKPIYVLISSLAFTAIHWEQGLAGMTSTFAFGFVAALFYLQLKNLWPMIASHTLVDVYYFW